MLMNVNIWGRLALCILYRNGFTESDSFAFKETELFTFQESIYLFERFPPVFWIKNLELQVTNAVDRIEPN